jgi:serine protease
MKQVSYIFLLAVVSLMSCAKSDKDQQNTATLTFKDTEIADLEGKEQLSKTALDKAFLDMMQRKGDFQWNWIDDYSFWSAVKSVQPLVAIGYKPSSYKGNIADEIHTIDIKSAEWRAVHDALLAFAKKELQTKLGDKFDEANFIYEDDQVLPRIVLRIDDYELLAKLRRSDNVRYIEPLDFDFSESEQRSSSGCGGTPVASLPTGDYTTTTPNALVPWNFTTMNIPNAWNITGAMNGSGITIGVIDAGISSTQPLLNAQFSSGSSTGRSVNASYTFGSSAYTSCTHGSSMCGLAAGPRNSSGSTMGVAWRSNLQFVRACDDVLLDGADERTGVKDALVQLGNNNSVKIISMSVGTPFSSSTLEDGVNYAYNKGKLIFAAGGTSYSWTSWWGVIYPAKLDKCVAMTGIKENGSTCTVCHDGSEIDFTVTMERNVNSDRSSLSYHTAGTLPSYVGGSSCATAMGAGMAALVWSVKPNWTRDQVLNALKTTSQNYPNPSGTYGWGKINPAAAVNWAKTQN